MNDPINWDLAECRGMTDLFYPEQFESAKQAKAVCAECPIVKQCLEYALDLGDMEGIWGGKSPKERAKLRVGRPKPPSVIVHGTTGGYNKERQRNLTPCDQCKEAHATYVRLKKQERRLAEHR
jgi:WhiB family redox-sensing transcriptional regulator